MVHVIYLSIILIAAAFWNRADRAARIAKGASSIIATRLRMHQDTEDSYVRRIEALTEDLEWAEAELKRTKRLLTETQHAVKNAPGKNNGKARRPRVRQRPSSSAHQTVP